MIDSKSSLLDCYIPNNVLIDENLAVPVKDILLSL